MNQVKIGNYILKKRKEKNMTQEQLAEQLNVSNKTISKWECGKSLPDYSIIESLCSVLKISTSELFAGEDNSQLNENKLIEMLERIQRLENQKNNILGILLIILGIARELIEYAINDSKNKGMSGICTLASKKKKPFVGDKGFYEHYGFKVVDTIQDYELMAIQFDDNKPPKFNDTAKKMEIETTDFTIYYSPECPYVLNCIDEITEYSKENNISLNIIKIDTLEKAKNLPCVFNNWAVFKNGKFVSNTLLNKNSFKKMLED